MEGITCTHCYKSTLFSEMSKDASDRRGHRGMCKICAAKKSAKYRDDNPEKYKATLRVCARKRLYGVKGVEHFNEQYRQQNGLCAICHNLMTKACSDHNHETGKWRGLLCDNCNRGLGLLKDRIAVLESAVAYLKIWDRANL